MWSGCVKEDTRVLGIQGVSEEVARGWRQMVPWQVVPRCERGAKAFHGFVCI